jgi:hypothetical protein
LSFEVEKDGRSRGDDQDPELKDSPVQSNKPEKPEASTPSQRKRKTPVNDLGDALKTVYDRTVNEEIPPEMLDLLGKLG